MKMLQYYPHNAVTDKAVTNNGVRNRSLYLKVKNKLRYFPVLLLGFVFSFLAGCSTKRITVPAPVDIMPPFSRSGKAVIPEKWWTAFDDQQLNALVATALEGNLDLQTAWQRLQAARAVVRSQSLLLWPEIDSSLQAETSRSPQDSGTNTDTDSELRLGLTAEYEVDLWGRPPN